MLPPASIPGDCFGQVRTLLHLPTTDAAILRAFARSQSPLASSHFFPRSSASFRSRRRRSLSTPNGAENVVRTLHQQRSQIRISFFADVHLRSSPRSITARRWFDSNIWLLSTTLLIVRLKAPRGGIASMTRIVDAVNYNTSLEPWVAVLLTGGDTDDGVWRKAGSRSVRPQ